MKFITSFTKIVLFLCTTLVVTVVHADLQNSTMQYHSTSTVTSETALPTNFNFTFVGRMIPTRRRPLTAVVPRGPLSFSIAYVEPLSATGDPHRVGGALKVRDFDARSGHQSAETIVNLNRVGFIRSSMSPPITINDCPTVIDGLRLNSPQYLLQGTVNFTAFDEWGDLFGSPPPRVKLLVSRSCPSGVKHRTIDVGEGRKPSVAIGKDDAGRPLILVVFGEPNNGIQGKFYNEMGEALGPAFLIHLYDSIEDGPWHTTNTDLIWNHRSNRFIAGFTLTSTRLLDRAGCRLYNLSVMPDGGSSVPIERGGCDIETSGHHTWVDIDKRTATNPDGVYAWWHERDGFLKKGIILMDRFGNPTGEQAYWDDAGGRVDFTTAYTVPFAAVNKPTLYDPVGTSIPNGPIVPHYTTAAEHAGHTGDHENDIFAVRGFDPDGRIIRGNSLSNTVYGWTTVAVGSLSEHTVYVYANTGGCGLDCPWYYLFMSIVPNEIHRKVY